MSVDDFTLTRPAVGSTVGPGPLPTQAAGTGLLDPAGPSAPPPAIAVDALSIGYTTGGRLTPTVFEASFEVPAGSTTALVGESGSGKSTIASAISGLLPENARLLTGGVRLLGQDVTRLGERGWRTVRGSILGYVPQDPLGSLDPLQTVGGHVTSSVRRARGVSEQEARRIALELLETVACDAETHPACEALVAYYCWGCDSREMFEGLDVSRRSDFGEHLNAYNVVRLDVTAFTGTVGAEVVPHDQARQGLQDCGRQGQVRLPQALRQRQGQGVQGRQGHGQEGPEEG